MKMLLISLSLLTFSASMINTGHAQVRSSYGQSKKPVYAYCEESRFENYILLSNAMRDFVTPDEFEKLYLPLRKKAAIAKITLKNYGALSSTTHKAVLDIVNFVGTNQDSFSSLWEVEAFFVIAQDLMDMTQALSRDLQ